MIPKHEANLYKGNLMNNENYPTLYDNFKKEGKNENVNESVILNESLIQHMVK